MNDLLQELLDTPNPNDEVWNFKVGEVYGKLNDYENCIKYSLKSYELGCTSKDLYTQIGYSYSGLDDHVKALYYYKKAVDAGRMDSFILQELGWTYAKLNNFEESNVHYKESMMYENPSTWLYYQIGLNNYNIFLIFKEYITSTGQTLDKIKFDFNDFKEYSLKNNLNEAEDASYYIKALNDSLSEFINSEIIEEIDEEYVNFICTVIDDLILTKTNKDDLEKLRYAKVYYKKILRSKDK